MDVAVGVGADASEGQRSPPQTDSRPRRLARLHRRYGRFLRRHSLFALFVLFGTALRVAALVAERPALMLYGDSYTYLGNSVVLRPNTFHPIFYAIALRALLWTNSVFAIAAAQHVLALILAGVLYAALLRLRVSPWLAALACAPLLLDSYQIFVEQTVVSETVFEVLLTGALILLVLRSPPRLGIVVLIGLLLAAATLTRGLAFLAAVPAIVIFFLLRRSGWLRGIVLIAVIALPVGLYGYWYKETNGQFSLEGMSGRLYYGRVESIAYQHCATLDPKLPADERKLCDPKLGADPKEAGSPNDGANYFAWAPGSPFYRLHPPAGKTPDQLATNYAKKVAEAEPAAFIWSTIVNTAHFFAPTRAGINPEAPIQEWQFLRRTEPMQLHMLLGTTSWYQQGSPSSPPSNAHWPISWLITYQSFGYTSGLILLASLLLVIAAFLTRGRREVITERQRSAALLFGLTGLLLLVVPAALTGDEPRYLIPVLPLIPPAGALALQSLAPSLRSMMLRPTRRKPVVRPAD